MRARCEAGTGGVNAHHVRSRAKYDELDGLEEGQGGEERLLAQLLRMNREYYGSDGASTARRQTCMYDRAGALFRSSLFETKGRTCKREERYNYSL